MARLQSCNNTLLEDQAIDSLIFMITCTFSLCFRYWNVENRISITSCVMVEVTARKNYVLLFVVRVINSFDGHSI